jgi:hypothetical protein
MGYAELIEKLQALPVDKRDEVFDFVEFLAARCSKAYTEPGDCRDRGEWSKASFSDFSIEQAFRGMEDDPVSYSKDDLRERWQ